MPKVQTGKVGMAGGVDVGALSRGREDGEMMNCLVKLQKAA